MNHGMKQLNVQPKNFTGRKYYPGTSEHPFHFISTLQAVLEKVPAPFYIILFGGITFLISKDFSKSVLIGVAVLLDWLLLFFLPKLKLSYGPPTLTMVLLGLMRLPFLLFIFPISLVFQILGTLLVIYAFCIEPLYPRVESYKVSLADRSHTGSLRIVQLSDLHMAYYSHLETKVVEKVNELNPDLILFTGDFFNLSNQDDPQTILDIQRFFTQLKAKYGIFGITGSPAVDLPESLDRLPADLGLEIIDNQSRTLSINSLQIRLVGLSCTQQPDPDSDRLKVILSRIDEDNPDATILLYHTPDIAPRISDWPIDLQLSGHTHGGQVRIPVIGPIFTASLYGLRFSSGYYQINNGIRLIISRGLGLEGNAAPRVRFLSPPEIGVITIEIVQDKVE